MYLTEKAECLKLFQLKKKDNPDVHTHTSEMGIKKLKGGYWFVVAFLL